MGCEQADRNKCQRVQQLGRLARSCSCEAAHCTLQQRYRIRYVLHTEAAWASSTRLPVAEGTVTPSQPRRLFHAVGEDTTLPCIDNTGTLRLPSPGRSPTITASLHGTKAWLATCCCMSTIHPSHATCCVACTSVDSLSVHPKPCSTCSPSRKAVSQP